MISLFYGPKHVNFWSQRVCFWVGFLFQIVLKHFLTGNPIGVVCMLHRIDPELSVHFSFGKRMNIVISRFSVALDLEIQNFLFRSWLCTHVSLLALRDIFCDHSQLYSKQVSCSLYYLTRSPHISYISLEHKSRCSILYFLMLKYFYCLYMSVTFIWRFSSHFKKHLNISL